MNKITRNVSLNTRYRILCSMLFGFLLSGIVLTPKVSYAHPPLPYAVTQPVVRTMSSNPHALTVLNNRLYFVTASNQLWQSDGTASGTTLIKELYRCNEDFGCQTTIIAHQNRIYISRSNNLWQSDGTPNGTNILFTASTSAISSLISFNNALYFAAANTPNLFTSLWQSDGTTAGTTIVNNVPGGITCPLAFKARLYCRGGNELWQSDGSAAGTIRLKAIPTGEINPNNTVFLAGETFFYFFVTGSFVSELWKSDGSEAGTMLVASLAVGNSRQYHQLLLTQGNRLYFAIYQDVNRYELWRSDGDGASTVKLADLPAPYLAALNDKVYFFGQDAATGNELWQSDGTPGGTHLFKEINPGPASSGPQSLFSSDDQLYFFADDGQHGMELWRSDGSPAGTTLHKEIYPGPDGSTNRPVQFVQLGQSGEFFFSAFGAGVGYELWKSSSAGTTLVRDLNPTVGADILGWSPIPLATIDNRLFFYDDDGSLTYKIYVSDGTIQGTGPMAELRVNHDQFGVGTGDIAKIGNTLYLSSNNATIWQIDVTPQGQQVKQRWQVEPQTRLEALYATNSQLYAIVRRQPSGLPESYELWALDQGETAARKLMAWSHQPQNFAAIGNELYFAAVAMNSNQIGLWRSNGTVEGTTTVKDLNIRELIAANGRLFLVTMDNNTATLWQSDGTTDGTVPVKTVNAFWLTQAGNLLYFITSVDSGHELWKSDGTPDGTAKVDTPANGLPLTNLFTFGETFFFWSKTATDSTLWRSDGTPGGTVMVKTIASIQCSQAVPTTHYFYFFCGNTLWQSDESEVSTVAIAQVAFPQGPAAASIQQATFMGTTNQVYFSVGNRLWVLDERLVERGFLPLIAK